MDMDMYRKGIRPAVYFEPEKIADDEEFKVIGNDVVDNIIETRYLISNYGRIYDTFDNRFMCDNYTRKGLKKDGTPKGYKVCKLRYMKEDGTTDRKGVILSRAVAITFIPNENYSELEVNHKNGNHADNSVNNLEWTTTEENMQHARDNNLYPTGELSSSAIMTNKQVEAICDMIMEGKRNYEIAKITGFRADLISDIRNKVSYVKITEKYDFPDLGLRHPEPSDEDVIEIANMIKSGYTFDIIAKKFNITTQKVSDIKYGKYKPDLTKDYDFSICIDSEKESLIRSICEDLQSGMVPSEVSKKYNKPISFIQSIISKHGYEYISKDYNIPSFDRKLDDETVIAICEDIMKNNISYADIGRKYNIPAGTIQAIGYKNTYNHITKNYDFPEYHNPNKITDDQVHEICKMLQNGISCARIGRELGIDTSTIYHIKYRDTHQEIVKNYKW